MLTSGISSMHDVLTGSEAPVSHPYATRPSAVYAESQPDFVVIPRRFLERLAISDNTLFSFRVLSLLLARHDEESGTVRTTQDKIRKSLGASKPSVNRAFALLREEGIVWALEDGWYQLHPSLTRGRVAKPMAVPPLKDVDRGKLSSQRRQVYSAQIANLGHTA